MKIEVSNAPTFNLDYAQSIVNIVSFKRRKLVEMVDITHMTDGGLQIHQSFDSEYDSALIDISREKMLGYNVKKIA